MEKEIIVYSTPLCSPCDQLKQFLADKGVKFKVVDLMMDEDAADLMESNGIRSVPVLSVDNDLLYGEALKQENLQQVLNLS